MIHELPREISLEISRYLAFKDKLNLAKTCSTLYKLISRASLFETLDLFNNVKRPDKLVKRFKRNEFDGTQVKDLTILMGGILEEERSQLHLIFPNVTRIQVCADDQNFPRVWSRPKEGLNPIMARWINTIQMYDIFTDWAEVLLALRFNVFPHLTDLKLSHRFTEYERREELDPFYFEPFIKNAPCLTKLTLYDCDINLEFLEVVHNSCPHLRALSLTGLIIVIDTPSLPEHLIPADGMLNLEVYDVSNFDRNGLLLEYVLKKYPNLHSLTFSLDGQDYRVRDKLEPYFNDYYHDLDTDDDDFDEPDTIVSRLNEDFYLGNLVYASTATSFFSKLPKTIKTLKMDVRSLNALIETISDANMNLTELDFCGEHYYRNPLKNANQFRCFQKMTTLKTLKIGISTAVQKYQHDCISSSITKLVVTCPNGPVYLYWILEMFPSLEYLCIKDSECDLRHCSKKPNVDALTPRTIEYLCKKSSQSDPGQFSKKSNINTLVHPTLKSLRLSKCSLTPQVVNYIKGLATVLESKGRIYDIDLTGCQLKEFTMSLSSSRFFTKNPESKRQFIIQKTTEQTIDAAWGEGISLEQVGGNSKMLEYKAKVKGLYE